MRHLITNRLVPAALLVAFAVAAAAQTATASAALPVSSGRLQVDIAPSMQRTLRAAGVTVFQTGRTSPRGATSFPYIFGQGAVLDPLRAGGGSIPLRNGFSFARGGTAGARFEQLTVRFGATSGAVAATASSGRRYGMKMTLFSVRRTATRATRRVPWYFQEEGISLRLTAPAARLLNRSLGRSAFRAGAPFATVALRAGLRELDVTSTTVRLTFSDTLSANGIVPGPVAPAAAENGTIRLPVSTSGRMTIEQTGGRTIDPSAPVLATLGDLTTTGGIAFSKAGRSLTLTGIGLSADHALRSTTDDPRRPELQAVVDTVPATPTGDRAFSWRAAAIRLGFDAARAFDTLADPSELGGLGTSPFAAQGGFATADIDVVVR